MDWDTIAEFSEKWANEYELTLAKDFVERLDALPEGETGRLLFQVDGKDAAGEPIAREVSKRCRARRCWAWWRRWARSRRDPMGRRWRAGFV